MNIFHFGSGKIFYLFICMIITYQLCCGEYVITTEFDDSTYKNPVTSGIENNLGHHQRYARSVHDDTSVKRTKAKAFKDSKNHDPVVSHFELKNSHHQVTVDWAGEGSQVVVCVTKDVNQNKNSTTNVYISYDYGSTFKDKSSEFKIGNVSGIIYKFYKNEKFTDRFIFADTVNKFLFVTNDFGYTIHSRKLSFTPSEVSLHPSNSHTFLIMDKEDKKKRLWFTTDFGETWSVLSFYVKSYYWSETSSVPTLYVAREEPGNENTVLAFQSISEVGDPEQRVIIEGVREFVVKGDFLFAFKKKPRLLGARSYEDSLQLWISYNEGPFLLAQFPNNLSHYHYYVVDTSEGQIMICVFHGISSNLYVSSIPRSSGEQIRFSLSLERVLYFSPNTNWNNTWLSKKAHEKFADIHLVKGIRGVLIASQLFSNYTKMSPVLGPEHLTSLISFDLGGEWKPLTPPSVDNVGRMTNCSLENGCSLHISQELSKLYPGAQSRPIFTSKSSPGIILSTGTLGRSLKGHPGVYLSTDAGVIWHQVLKGNYLYTFGDHGGVMMAVQHYRSNGETNEILYSIDEGETWHSHQFFKEKIRVYGLMTEPGENTTIFTLFGSKLEKHEWIIVKIDMYPVFQYKCTKDDYKTWTPSDASSGRQCLLGRRDVYERRIPHSNCYNGIDYDRPVTSESCPCTRDDYECDFGFLSSVQGSSTEPPECVKDEDDIVSPFNVPFTCKHGKMYNRTKGYRKVPGDTCSGGEAGRYDAVMTPCPLDEEKEFLLVSNRQRILRYDLLNPTEGLQPLPLGDLGEVIALDFHLKNNCLYWSENGGKVIVENSGKILRQCFDGEHHLETLISTDLRSVEGLALDWVSNTLYFVDGTKKTVEVTRIVPPFSGEIRAVLLQEPSVDLPRGIALHPVKGLMFLTDWSKTKPMVAKAHLDGTNLKILFGTGQVGWPNGIAVDFQTEKIFWADAKLDYIASSDMDGNGFKKIVSNEANVRQPFAVAVYKSMLYWDDWTALRIFRADKEHEGNVTPLTDAMMKGLVDLKVFGHWSQSGSNACGEPENSCQFFCMGKPNNDYTCLCPSWLLTVGEGKERRCVCRGGQDPTPKGICKGSEVTCPPNSFHCDNNNCIPNSMVCDSDNDCGDLSDEKNCGRSFCGDDSWQCENGLCISSAWKCDKDNDCGDNSDEEGCPYETCTDEQFTCKNNLCIDKHWVCDFQNDCHDMSDETNCTYGSSFESVCSANQFKCKESGICLPISWRCDNEKDCVDNSDEENCTSHKCNSFHFQCTNSRCIYKSWVCDGAEDCEDGLDEKNCSAITNATSPSESTSPIPLFPVSKNYTCSSYEFRCTSGVCIPFWWRCDNASDCPDGSDETNCLEEPNPNTERPPGEASTRKPCRQDQMECSNGDCVWESWVCDGDNDCYSGEDEENCHQRTNCGPNMFRCWHSEGCVHNRLLCDGRKDCADGSDETSCVVVVEPNKTEAASGCAEGFFSCDGGHCLPDRKRCDSNVDCIDMTDEVCGEGKSSKVYQVENLEELKSTNVSLKFRWDFNAKTNGTVEFLPSCIVQSAIGNPNAWKNATWITDKFYTFTDLQPYTTYRLVVYVRVEGKTYVPADTLNMTTTVGIPSPPTNVQVTQSGEKLVIEWDEPHHPNGPVDLYRVYVYPPSPAKLFEVKEGVHKLSYLPSQLQLNLTIWTTCSNSEFTSDSSEKVVFIPLSVDRAVNNLSVKSKRISEVTLEWQPIPNVEGYIVSYTYPENQNIGSRFSVNVTGPEVHLTNLAPGLRYVFKVSGLIGNAIGPFTTLEVMTPGKKLPRLKVSAEVLKYPGTSIQVSWEEPTYSQKHLWQYKVLWGKTPNDLKEQLNRGETTNTSFLIQNLDACESYMIAVMVAGPIGIGPSAELTMRTNEDQYAPPKNLAVTSENNIMNITWKPSCPQFLDMSLKYLVTITEVNFNKSSYFAVPTRKVGIMQGHSVEMHYGGKYMITVKTYLNDSRPSPPVFINGPRIPPPYDITFTPSDNSFFWRNSKTIPTELLKNNHSYILYLALADRNNSSKSSTIEIEVKEPPYQATEIEPGRIYHASVAFKNSDGYLSPRSQIMTVEKSIGDGIVVTETSVVGVAVSVTIVLVILVALVAIMAVRHKRLARSFTTFVNSHYDRSQGTTHITTDHNLDEDDSPMIRGFSDDEPLVIA